MQQEAQCQLFPANDAGGEKELRINPLGKKLEGPRVR
jgi:hypothetical protein